MDMCVERAHQFDERMVAMVSTIRQRRGGTGHPEGSQWTTEMKQVPQLGVDIQLVDPRCNRKAPTRMTSNQVCWSHKAR